jgi:hypothetical protein
MISCNSEDRRSTESTCWGDTVISTVRRRVQAEPQLTTRIPSAAANLACSSRFL